MLSPIIEHIESQDILPEIGIDNLKSVSDWLESISEETIKILKKIFEKYKFENLDVHRHYYKTETFLEFWKSIDSYSLSPAFEKKDPDYLNFIDDLNGYIKNPDYTPSDSNKSLFYYHNIDRLFYSWFAYLCQKAKSQSCGIPVCTFENNSAKRFYVNDFLFSEFSAYNKLRESESRIEGAKFVRELGAFEIYSRTYFYLEIPNLKITWDFIKEKEKRTIKLNHNSIIKFKNEIYESSQIIEPDANYDNSHKVATKKFIDLADQLINTGWEIKVESENKGN